MSKKWISGRSYERGRGVFKKIDQELLCLNWRYNSPYVASHNPRDVYLKQYRCWSTFPLLSNPHMLDKPRHKKDDDLYNIILTCSGDSGCAQMRRSLEVLLSSTGCLWPWSHLVVLGVLINVLQQIFLLPLWHIVCSARMGIFHSALMGIPHWWAFSCHRTPAPSKYWGTFASSIHFTLDF